MKKLGRPLLIALAFLVLTLVLSSWRVVGEVIAPILAGIVRLPFAAIGAFPDRAVWLMMLALVVPILLAEMVMMFIALTGRDKLPEPLPEQENKGAVEEYGRWSAEMEHNLYLNDQMAQLLGRFASQTANRTDKVSRADLEELLLNVDTPPAVTKYLAHSFDNDLRHSRKRSDNGRQQLEATLRWLEQKNNIQPQPVFEHIAEIGAETESIG